MQTASEASHSPALLLPEKPPVKTRRSPSYLYRKGNIFYFRYAFSAQEKQRLQRAEIRISLRTGFIHEARKKARQLRAALEEFMTKEQTMPSPQEVREHMLATLKELMESCSEKRPPSSVEIRQRMDRMRQDMLDTMDANLYQPIGGSVLDGDTVVQTSVSEGVESYIQGVQHVVNDQEALKSLLYPHVIFELLMHNYFAPEELTQENIPQILNEYQKMQIFLARIFQAREKGDYQYERTFEATQSKAVEPAPPVKPASPMLSDFIEKYIATKLADKQWTLRNLPTHRSRLEPLVEVLGNLPIADITREDMRKYREVLCKLPPNRARSVKYKGKTIQELLAMTPADTLNVKTINIFVEAVASMFEWGIREGLLEANPAKALQIKDNRQDIDLRDAFTPEEIQKMFFSGDYVPEKFIHPAYYWAPLIGLYSGMRLEEICQLHCDDIVQEGSVWCFDLNINPSKSGIVDKALKNKNAARRVPVHDELIRLGFMNHVQSMRKKGHERIFPELNKTDKTPKYGKQVGKSFSRLIKAYGIKGKKSFHSLRHSVSGYFKVRNMHNDVYRQVFGHEIPGLAGRQYGSRFSAKQCYDDIISQLRWGDAHDHE